MESVDLKHIWKNGQENMPNRTVYTLADIQAYRKKKSRETSRTGRLSMIFDIGYKTIVAMGLGFLLSLVEEPLHLLVVSLMLAFTMVLIWVELRFVKRLARIKEIDAVIDNLKHQLSFLRETYKKFLYFGALSNPLFVLTGFLLYHYFKYDGIQAQNPLNDPLTYAFLAVAYGVSIIGQWPFYKKQVSELGASIQFIDDEYMAAVQIEDERKSKLKYTIMFFMLMLIGILILLLLLYR
ncbi:MAG: hypothetical protein HEP71_15055 [Roseivirga sp.]|nr:hypothetical protein [Roseivirga sp.]